MTILAFSPTPLPTLSTPKSTDLCYGDITERAEASISYGYVALVLPSHTIPTLFKIESTVSELGKKAVEKAKEYHTTWLAEKKLLEDFKKTKIIRDHYFNSARLFAESHTKHVLKFGQLEILSARLRHQEINLLYTKEKERMVVEFEKINLRYELQHKGVLGLRKRTELLTKELTNINEKLSNLIREFQFLAVQLESKDSFFYKKRFERVELTQDHIIGLGSKIQEEVRSILQS